MDDRGDRVWVRLVLTVASRLPSRQVSGREQRVTAEKTWGTKRAQDVQARLDSVLQ